MEAVLDGLRLWYLLECDRRAAGGIVADEQDGVPGVAPSATCRSRTAPQNRASAAASVQSTARPKKVVAMACVSFRGRRASQRTERYTAYPGSGRLPGSRFLTWDCPGTRSRSSAAASFRPATGGQHALIPAEGPHPAHGGQASRPPALVLSPSGTGGRFPAASATASSGGSHRTDIRRRCAGPAKRTPTAAPTQQVRHAPRHGDRTPPWRYHAAKRRLPNIRLSCGWDAGRGAGTDLPVKRVIAGWPPR